MDVIGRNSTILCKPLYLDGSDFTAYVQEFRSNSY